MVVLSKIYTKTGDAGETALGNGARVAKHSLRVSAYGTVDETNATVGLARLHATGDMAEALKRISNDLFDLGADLCTPDRHLDPTLSYTPLRMIEGQVTRLEREIDSFNADLGELRSFILRGGHAGAAHLHHACTVSRRALWTLTRRSSGPVWSSAATSDQNPSSPSCSCRGMATQSGRL